MSLEFLFIPFGWLYVARVDKELQLSTPNVIACAYAPAQANLPMCWIVLGQEILPHSPRLRRRGLQSSGKADTGKTGGNIHCEKRTEV
jgi:hypothetical protein